MLSITRSAIAVISAVSRMLMKPTKISSTKERLTRVWSAAFGDHRDSLFSFIATLRQHVLVRGAEWNKMKKWNNMKNWNIRLCESILPFSDEIWLRFFCNLIWWIVVMASRIFSFIVKLAIEGWLITRRSSVFLRFWKKSMKSDWILFSALKNWSSQ